MFFWIQRSLMPRLVIFFFLTAVIPIALVSYIVFHLSEEDLHASYSEELTTAREVKKKQLIQYLRDRLIDVDILSHSMDVQVALNKLERFGRQRNRISGETLDKTSHEYAAACRSIDPYFRRYFKSYGYYNIFIISWDQGRVLYAVARGQDFGTSLKSGPYRESGLARLWADIVRNRRPSMVDFSIYVPSGCPSFFIGAPILDKKGNALGVVAFQLGVKHIDSIMYGKAGIGTAGEVFLVGQDRLMRSNLRLKKETGTLLKEKVDTPAVREALEGKEGIRLVRDSGGKEVLCSYSPLGLNQELGTDFDWVIVADGNKANIFASIKILEQESEGIALIFAILACLLGYFSARSIVNPLKMLSEKLRQIAGGDLTVNIPETRRKDEIGIVLASFRTMLKAFRDQTREIVKGTNNLASSINQISTTSAQLASISAETAASISEVSTTTEEVRQTTYASNKMAQQVTEIAKKTEEISKDGKKVTEDSIKSMHHIKDEVAYLTDTIVKLSEQTQSIGEIIVAVNDIVDQTNLLSVNASIEAAKAGEHGKGFAVVAQEVKSLAEQSKEATGQVRDILKDIQKATSSAVMAAERGSKAVEIGMQMSSRASSTINILTESVTESAEHAMQISASSKEQLVGIDQLAQAMRDIKEAGSQNVDSSRQLEEATKALQELSSRLKELSDRFRVDLRSCPIASRPDTRS